MQSSLPASSKILFVSDVHLGAFSAEKNERLERELIGLIDYAARKGYRLAVLGDLFDYWIEYPSHVPELGKALLQRFQRFHAQHPPTLYITGNHDNWTLGHFTERGFEVEPDARILQVGGQRMLLMHGDAVGPRPDRLQRPLLHRLIRSAPFLRTFRSLLPPKAGLRIMKHYSALSRSLGTEESDPAKLDHWARKLLQSDRLELLLCGHDHVPRVRKYDYGTYINLGTFHYHHSLAEYNNGNISLVTWNNKKRELSSYSLPRHST